MDDGTIVDTVKASLSLKEDTRWDGNNHISLATGSQWDHQTLYRSSKGRYYIEHTSQWQGRTPSAEWADHRAAAAWLTLNAEDVPPDLAEALAEVTE